MGIAHYKIIGLTILFFLSISCNDKENPPVDNPDPDIPEDITPTPWMHDTPFPFNMPPKETLRASEKKVFAHYFTQFPISIDNKEGETDYYQTQYLTVNGENGIHVAYGGYLRIRPIPQEPLQAENWRELNMEEEVRRAIALGIDGFACDLLSSEGYHLAQTIRLLNAAEAVDPGFKILLMPDMEVFKNRPMEDLTATIKLLSDYPSAYRLQDNRLVISPFNTQRWEASVWQDWLITMADLDIDIAFVPLFQGWSQYAASFAPFSYGMSDWGLRSPKIQANWISVPAQAQAYGVIWMMPVASQDMRPRSHFYWESGNSEAYRVMWKNSIEGGADWVHLITWNDYAEHTVIAPSTGTQYAFYDLTAFYTTWFKTGVQPAIERDVLYYFHRKHATSASPSQQQKRFTASQGSDTPLDEIEVLAFLKEAGTVEIWIGGTKQTKEFTSGGIHSFKVPLKEGTPIFRLVRNGEEVVALKSAFEINNDIEYQDLLYYGGSNSRNDIIN